MFSELSRLVVLPMRLHHDADRAALGIGVFDGDRNAFALLVQPQDYELPRFLLACNARRLDDEPLDAGRQKLSVQDFEHVSPWLALQDIVRKGKPMGCDMSHVSSESKITQVAPPSRRQAGGPARQLCKLLTDNTKLSECKKRPTNSTPATGPGYWLR